MEKKVQGGFLPSLSPGEKESTYTLVLDMDETLIHFDHEKPLVNGDLLSSVEYRPYLDKFLKNLAIHFEIVIFTSALSEYADVILDHIDPDHTLFSYRLYRQHCLHQNGQYIKDLSRIGRALERTIILDNLKENFCLQPLNGIFIDTWTDDKEDHLLNDLIPLLSSLAVRKVADVRSSLLVYRDSVIRYINKTEGVTLGDFTFTDEHSEQQELKETASENEPV